MVRCPFMATVHGERGEEWERVLGRRTFPIVSWNPQLASLPGLGVREVVMVSVADLPADDLARIVAHIAVKFGLTEDEVRSDIEASGIPILYEDVSLILDSPQRWI